MTRTLARSIHRQNQERIVSDALSMSHLSECCISIIRYIYDVSPACAFEHETEWVLRPDNWVSLKFTCQRKTVLHLSLGTPLISERVDAPISNGRFPNWSRVSFESPRQLPQIMALVEQAYIHSENQYRKKYGAPKIVNKALEVPKSYSLHYDQLIENSLSGFNQQTGAASS